MSRSTRGRAHAPLVVNARLSPGPERSSWRHSTPPGSNRSSARSAWARFEEIADAAQQALAGRTVLTARGPRRPGVGCFASWAGLLVLGWTLVFLPHVPERFHRATAGPADSDLVEALNVSLVTLTTLGFGDVTPDAAWWRVVVPIEALRDHAGSSTT